MARRPGITLIELMVALAVTGMLLAATLAVVSNLSRTLGPQEREHADRMVCGSIEAALQPDLVHATYCLTTPTGFRLKTLASLNPDTMEQQHLGAIVEYRVQTIGPRNWLVRTQQSEVNGITCSQLVCSGVDRVILESQDAPPASAAPAGSKASNVPTAPKNTVVGPTPAQVNAVPGVPLPGEASQPVELWKPVTSATAVTVTFAGNGRDPAVCLVQRE